jgi:hypothetical protein
MKKERKWYKNKKKMTEGKEEGWKKSKRRK